MLDFKHNKEINTATEQRDYLTLVLLSVFETHTHTHPQNLMLIDSMFKVEAYRSFKLGTVLEEMEAEY